jgi:hypothetical protein
MTKLSSNDTGSTTCVAASSSRLKQTLDGPTCYKASWLPSGTKFKSNSSPTTIPSSNWTAENGQGQFGHASSFLLFGPLCKNNVTSEMPTDTDGPKNKTMASDVPISTSIIALHKKASDMLAADRDVLGDVPPERLTHHPAGLERWVKQTKAKVQRSKAAALASIHRTHERLTHYFRYRPKKKHGIAPVTADTIRTQYEKDLEQPGPV